MSRLDARPPTTPPRSGRAPGLHVLDAGPGPEVLLHVPPPAPDGRPPRLVLTLHGAGGTAAAGLVPLLPLADDHGLLLLSPGSRGTTWDVVRGGWGPDVRRVDEALQEVLDTHAVDGGGIAVSGFSDGASYALSLGLANADLLRRIVAFSPGFAVEPDRPPAVPEVFLSHGRADAVLPIDRTSRRIVPRLRAAGVPVEVREFDGAHVVPPGIAAEAVAWLGA